jgi:hypothetical protein
MYVYMNVCNVCMCITYLCMYPYMYVCIYISTYVCMYASMYGGAKQSMRKVPYFFCLSNVFLMRII